jgi:hypothetical protein
VIAGVATKWQSEKPWRSRETTASVVDMRWMKVAVVIALALGGCADCSDPPAPATIAVALLVDGHPFVYGNDEYMTPNDCKPKPGDPPPSPSAPPCRVVKISPGLYRTIARTLDDSAPALAAAGADARGAIVIFGTGARVAFEGPLAELTGERLPGQAAQRDQLGGQIGEGLRLAADTLHDEPAARRVLIAIVSAHAARTLADDAPTRQRIAADHVEVIAIVVADDSTVDGDDDSPATRRLAALRAFGASVIQVRDREALPAALARVLQQVGAGQPIAVTP